MVLRNNTGWFFRSRTGCLGWKIPIGGSEGMRWHKGVHTGRGGALGKCHGYAQSQK